MTCPWAAARQVPTADTAVLAPHQHRAAAERNRAERHDIPGTIWTQLRGTPQGRTLYRQDQRRPVSAGHVHDGATNGLSFEQVFDPEHGLGPTHQ